MTDGKPNESQLESGQGRAVEGGGAVAPTRTLPGREAEVSDSSTLPKKLTADEQMALYEKELKENDWGHQPC
jgi:hypothetical protein